MKKFKLLNSFSLNMLTESYNGVQFLKVSTDAVRELAQQGRLESHIGHAETAAVIGALLGTEVAMNRSTVKLADDEIAIVAQYIGPRLPEGATSLPPEAVISYYAIVVQTLGAQESVELVSRLRERV